MSVISRDISGLPLEEIQTEVLKYLDDQSLSAISKVSKNWVDCFRTFILSDKIDCWMNDLHRFMRDRYNVIGEQNLDTKLNKFIASFFWAGANYQRLQQNSPLFRNFVEKYRDKVQQMREVSIPRVTLMSVSTPATRHRVKRKLFEDYPPSPGD